MVGLDKSGKTSLLYKLKLGEIVTTIPTIGFNVESINLALDDGPIEVTLWDLGGNAKIRALWKFYYASSDAIFFVIDISDPERIPEAKMEILKLLEEEELKYTPIFILATKSDEAKMTTDQLIESLELPVFSKSIHLVSSFSPDHDKLLETFKLII
jgi:ADP-ribosylation factor protein 1